jgi:hypothetical protein
MSSLRRSAWEARLRLWRRLHAWWFLNPPRRLPRHPLQARQPVLWRARRRRSTSSRRRHPKGGICRHLLQLMQQAKATKPSPNRRFFGRQILPPRNRFFLRGSAPDPAPKISFKISFPTATPISAFFCPVYCCVLCARERARAHNLRYRARASAQVKHHAVHQSPAGQQASRAGHHQGPQLRMVDLDGEGGEGAEGGEERGGGRGEREGGGRGGGQLPMCLSMLFLRPACAAILRVFVRSVSMFLFSCVACRVFFMCGCTAAFFLSFTAAFYARARAHNLRYRARAPARRPLRGPAPALVIACLAGSCGVRARARAACGGVVCMRACACAVRECGPPSPAYVVCPKVMLLLLPECFDPLLLCVC